MTDADDFWRLFDLAVADSPPPELGEARHRITGAAKRLDRSRYNRGMRFPSYGAGTSGRGSNRDADRKREADRRYRETHRERRRAEKAQYRRDHPDKIAEAHEREAERARTAAYQRRLDAATACLAEARESGMDEASTAALIASRMAPRRGR